MSIPSPRLPEGWPARLALFATLAALAYGVGFLFHTSFDPVLFGKYNLRYAVFLGAYFFLFVPLVHCIVKFLLTTNTIALRSGRTIIIRSRSKIAAAALAALSFYIVADVAARRLLATRTLTHAGDMYHPYLQNTPRPGDTTLNINRWGFRGENIEKEKPAGALRVFFFGGSTVFCGEVPFEDTHCRILEKRLRGAHPERRIEVQNVAAEWHCSQHSLMKLLLTAQEFSPDLVIVYHGINDLARSFSPDLFAEGEYRSDYGHYFGPVANLRRPRDIASSLVQSSHGHWLSDFRLERVRLLGPDGAGQDGRVVLFFPKAEPIEVERFNSLPAFERNLRDFAAIARSKGMRVVMASQPYLYRDDLSERERETIIFPISQQFAGKMASIGSMRRGLEQFNAAARQIAEEAGVPFVDLEQAVPKTLEYFYDDCHYTRKGNALIGQTMAEFIEQSGVLAEIAASQGAG